ncbi:MAG: hypothetical protein ACREMA_06195 [Longimicrobiales bacterium]
MLHSGSRDSTIVRVNQTSDLVAALIAGVHGTTTVVASSLARADRRDSVRIRVGGTTIPTPSVVITSITTATTSTPIDPANVTGRIEQRQLTFKNTR